MLDLDKCDEMEELYIELVKRKLYAETDFAKSISLVAEEEIT